MGYVTVGQANISCICAATENTFFFSWSITGFNAARRAFMLQCDSAGVPGGAVEKLSGHAGANAGRERLSGDRILTREGQYKSLEDKRSLLLYMWAPLKAFYNAAVSRAYLLCSLLPTLHVQLGKHDVV